MQLINFQISRLIFVLEFHCILKYAISSRKRWFSNWFFQSAKFLHDLAPLLDSYLNQVLIASVDRCQLVIIRHGSSRVDVICIGNRSETVSTSFIHFKKLREFILPNFARTFWITIFDHSAAPVHWPGVQIDMLCEGPFPVSLRENEHLQFEGFVAYFTGHFDKPCNGIGENRGDRGVSNSGHFGGSEDHFSLEKKLHYSKKDVEKFMMSLNSAQVQYFRMT